MTRPAMTVDGDRVGDARRAGRVLDDLLAEADGTVATMTAGWDGAAGVGWAVPGHPELGRPELDEMALDGGRAHYVERGYALGRLLEQHLPDDVTVEVAY